MIGQTTYNKLAPRVALGVPVPPWPRPGFAFNPVLIGLLKTSYVWAYTTCNAGSDPPTPTRHGATTLPDLSFPKVGPLLGGLLLGSLLVVRSWGPSSGLPYCRTYFVSLSTLGPCWVHVFYFYLRWPVCTQVCLQLQIKPQSQKAPKPARMPLGAPIQSDVTLT